jgi:ABC-2 type transport system permease protein
VNLRRVLRFVGNWLASVGHIWRRELLSLFVTPVAYLVGALFLLNQGWNFSLLLRVLNDPLAAAGPVMQHYFSGSFPLFWLPVISICSALTMRLIAEERRSGTIEALLTAPIDAVQIVVGKYLSALTFFSLLWLPTLLYYVLLRAANAGVGAPPPDLGPILAGYLGTFMAGATFLAFGTLSSALSRSQLAAAIAGFVGSTIFVLSGLLVEQVESVRLAEFLRWLDLLTMMREVSQGIVDLHWVGLHLSLVLSSLAFAVLATHSRREAQHVVQVVCFAVGVLALAVGMGRSSGRMDWTAGNVYGLSDRTKSILANLPRPVEIVVAVPTVIGGARTNPLRGELQEVLLRMAKEAPSLRFRLMDPDRDRQATERLVEDFGLDGHELADGVVLIRSGQGSNLRRSHIFPREFVSWASGADVQESGPRVSSFRGEEALLHAILSVTSEKRSRLCYSQGHGEPAFDSLEPYGGYANLRELLVNATFEVSPADFTLDDGLDACDVVLVAGADLAFSTGEVAKIGAYLEQGGDLLLLGGAVFHRGRTELANHGLEMILADYGIDLGHRVVLDGHQMAGETQFLAFTLAQGWADHPASRALIGRPVSFQFVREMQVRAPAAALLTTDEDAWAESTLTQITAIESARFDEARDLRGPFAVVAASEKAASRVVVVASDQFALNARLRQDVAYDYGREMILNLVAWLNRDEHLLGIGPRQREHIKLVLLPEQLSKMSIFALLGPSLFSGLLGVFILWRRRR